MPFTKMKSRSSKFHLVFDGSTYTGYRPAEGRKTKQAEKKVICDFLYTYLDKADNMAAPPNNDIFPFWLRTHGVYLSGINDDQKRDRNKWLTKL